MDDPKLKAKDSFWRSPRFLSLLFILPFTIGTVRSFWNRTYWFNDFEAMSCAGQALNAGHPLYVKHFPCRYVHPAAYIYTPTGAKIFAFLQNLFGLRLEIFIYTGIYLLVVLSILALLLKNDGRLADRAPFLAELPGSALPHGNVSVIMHGLILFCSRWFSKKPALLLPLVVAGAIFKPTFIVYLALFLFIKRPIRQRLFFASAGALIVSLYFMTFYLADFAAFSRWRTLVHFYGIVAERGNGFLGLPVIAHIASQPVIAVCYALFSFIILSSGLIVAEFCVENPTEKLLLGITTCLLLYPRLLGYDLFTLPFGLAVAVSCFDRIGAFQARHLARLLQLVCAVLAVIGGRAGERMLFDFYCVLLVFLAVAAVSMKVKNGHRLTSGKTAGTTAISIA